MRSANAVCNRWPDLPIDEHNASYYDVSARTSVNFRMIPIFVLNCSNNSSFISCGSGKSLQPKEGYQSLQEARLMRSKCSYSSIR